MVTRYVVVDNVGQKSLRKAYEYIKEDSPKNADNVLDKILKSIKYLVKDSERHKPDNDGTYRAYEIYSYRISYRVSDAEIRVLRIRHIKMNPLLY